MSNKLIIHNETNMSDSDVLYYIQKVVLQGQISQTKEGKQYCLATKFVDGFVITCSRKKNTFTFKIFYEKE